MSNHPKRGGGVAMENLDTKAEMFRDLVEHSCDVTIVTDRDFKIRYISSSATEVFGKEPMALLGRTVFDFVDKKQVDDWRNQFSDLSESRSLDVMITLPVDKQKRFFSAEVTNSFDDLNVRGLIIKLHDITNIKAREQELIESNLHLDQVFYKTTHDLKAPIRSVLGLVNLAEKAPDHQRMEYIAMIKKSLLKLDGFIEEMNDFFRGERLEIKREKIDVRSLISEEIDNLRNLHETGGISIEVDVHQRADFFSDLFRIRTITTNLISNAIKYSDAGKEQSWIRVEAVITGMECVLKVQDNGIGIEEQYQKKIYERFFRATGNSYGNGIGLFIVKDTVERLQGKIEVSSTPGEGTVFTVTIPNQSYRTVL